MAKQFTTLGIVAHVDAGKTTLTESLLFCAGKLAAAGRVDKGDAFLDTDAMEKQRGITIFSKQAELSLPGKNVTILDTPGHADFSAEMERALSVLDAAILVVSGADSVQSHTRTLWKLLSHYNIPTFFFVNKLDQVGADYDKVLSDLFALTDGKAVDFADYRAAGEEFCESVAVLSEATMESYLETGELGNREICELIKGRNVYPVFAGAALSHQGVEEFLEALDVFLPVFEGDCCAPFGARVYKIGRDDAGNRLTYARITSGTIKVKEMIGEEKLNEMRLLDGGSFTRIQEASAGMCVAFTGLSETYAGQGLGEESSSGEPMLTPVISYRLILPKEVEVAVALPKLMQLAEEQPDLSLVFDDEKNEISIKLMGEIQTQILTSKIKERFGYDVTFGESRIVYKETIKNTVEGVGHFEPLRHYAEVHLLLSPGEPGSGMTFDADCSEDILDRNWQRLIMTHLKEREHRGVLTGSGLTDVHITVASGRAHPKHTVGGDFRQATYRAIRQGLMQAESELLEPFYSFTLRVPSEYVGRAMTDLDRMHAADFAPETEGVMTVLTGRAPASTMQGYAAEVMAYTGGRGELSLSLWGYGPCHNADEVIAARDYDPLRDLRNTPDSVFCSHGAGVVVPWNEVPAHMHIPSVLAPTKELTDEQIRLRAKRAATSSSVSEFISPDEVDAIIKKAGSANQKPEFIPHKGINHKNRRETNAAPAKETVYKPKPKAILPKYLLVDGYNVIFADTELSALARTNLDAARGKLQDMLCNYQAIIGSEVIAVFDAYRLQNHAEEWQDYLNIHVVFTKTAETADHYIERFTHEKAEKYSITVATSDGVEQVIVRGANSLLMSSRELLADMQRVSKEFNDAHGVI